MERNTSMNQILINNWIEQYKDFIRHGKLEEEIYKWKAIKHFQLHWNDDALDFSKMFFKSISKQTNLFFQGSLSSIKLIVKEKPEDARQLFKQLFDENNDIEKRINDFQNSSEIILRSIKPNWKAQQDERTISVYLSFRYPEKYYLYKPTYYNHYLEKFGLKKENRGKRWFHFQKIAEEFKQQNIIPDEEMQNLIDSFLTDDCYIDPLRNVLTQDIFYFLQTRYSDKGSLNYWIFQCNPNEYDIINEWKNRDIDTWRVTAHKNEIKTGDKVILWVTGKDSGCYGLCTVTTDVNEGQENFVYLNIDHNLIQSPVRKSELINLPEFTNFKAGNQGTNFTATKEQFEKIHQLIMERDRKTDEIESIIKTEKTPFAPSNLILYGPPGTGKTYYTINQAVKIVEELSGAAFQQKYGNDRERLKDAFNNYCSTGQIQTVTFHQSFAYEDFIEGIKPVMSDENDGELRYKIENGIFKNICKKAEYNLVNKKSNRPILSENEFSQAQFCKMNIKDSLNPDDEAAFQFCIDNNCIGTDLGRDIDFSAFQNEKSITSKFKENSDYNFFEDVAIRCLKFWMKPGFIVLVPNGLSNVRAIGRITGEYYYKDVSDLGIQLKHFRNVEWLVKNANIPVSEIYSKSFSAMPIYLMFNKQIKREFFTKVNSSQFLNHVLIIDEINRGNISKIFGELITLIEPDKRLKMHEELKTRLPYSKEEFSVPPNLHIIGTMNTADRSIALMDTALRRRFDFVEMMPESGLLNFEIKGINLNQLLTIINERIEFLFDRDHTIGHAYFIKLKRMKEKETEEKAFEELCKTFKNKIIPLLQEYFYDDWRKIQLVLGDNQKWGKPAELRFINSEKKYSAKDEIGLFGEDLDDYEEVEKFNINPLFVQESYDMIRPESFIFIYQKP